MGKVMCEISMSLDGFITGPNARVGNGMGDDGDRLHDWKFDAKTEADTAIVEPPPAIGTSAWSGANIISQYLRAGLLDEMQSHLVPVLFGGGIRLFEDLGPDRIELRRTSWIETPGASHVRFDVMR